MRVPRVKTLVPELPSQFVSRPRLLEVLDDRPAGVMLVSAPPGYGKTLLLVDWVHRAGAAATAWVNLDRGDNDVERLCAAIAAALARCAAVPADSPVHQLATSRAGVPHEFLTDLADALDGLPVPIRLVLDDVQEIVGREALRTLQHILRHLPAGVRLVLLSRVDPPLALVRLRLEGRLAELRAEHLRFTRLGDCRAAHPERPGPHPRPGRDAARSNRRLACGPAAGGVVAGLPPRIPISSSISSRAMTVRWRTISSMRSSRPCPRTPANS